MPRNKDLRDLVKVLEIEELFLRNGGYDNAPADRLSGPTLIFQDSPTCPNQGCRTRNISCKDCVLFSLVPKHHRSDQVPCRHIPLNDIGETVDTLYKWGSLNETKMILADWLRKTIGDMKFMRARLRPISVSSREYKNLSDAT